MDLPDHPLPDCNSLWIGPALGRVERACLRSFVRQGHRVRLFAYGQVQGVPDGVELTDAAQILPSCEIRTYVDGSPALFSNRFRYELMARGAGLWVDTDVYCVRPLDLPDLHLFGWEHETLICTAVLRLPRASELLARLLELFGTSRAPAWLQGLDVGWARAHIAHGGAVRWVELSWGLTGPTALTWLVRELGLAERAQPQSVFYPASPHQADWVFDPRADLDEIVRPETRTIHLWNKLIAERKHLPALKGSFLARLQAEGAPGPTHAESARFRPSSEWGRGFGVSTG